MMHAMDVVALPPSQATMTAAPRFPRVCARPPRPLPRPPVDAAWVR